MKLKHAWLFTLSAMCAWANPGTYKWDPVPVQYQIASSADNTGATSINGGMAYSRAVELIQLSMSTWTKANVTTCPGSTTWDVQT